MKKTARILSIIVVVGVLLSVFPSSVSAFQVNGSHIEDMLLFIPYSGMDDETIVNFNEALYQWNSQINQTIMRRDPVVRHSRWDYPHNDGESLIYRLNTGTSNYVAQTQRYVIGNVTTSADINLNMYYAWTNGQDVGRYDVWTVFLHEAGHAAGLSHNENNSNAVMYPTVQTNTLKRYLSTDDIA